MSANYTEIAMVVGGSAVAAYLYANYGWQNSSISKNTIALVILSGGVALAAYQYTNLSANGAAIAGAVAGPIVDAASYAADAVAPVFSA